MRKTREFVIVLAVVALTMAVFSRRETPVGTATATATPLGEPTLVLQVVRRSQSLDDLVVIGKLTSPEPIVLALHKGLPVTYLELQIERRGFDLVHKSLVEKGYPAHLPVGDFVSETREVTEFEWEFWGREMTWSRRDMVESAFANPLELRVRVPYLNKNFQFGDSPTQQYKYLNAKVEVAALRDL